jgi:hypothetical protein
MHCAVKYTLYYICKARCRLWVRDSKKSGKLKTAMEQQLEMASERELGLVSLYGAVA